MSEEESFVILGSSPTESMDNYSIIQKFSDKKEPENTSDSIFMDTSEHQNKSLGDTSMNAMSNGLQKDVNTSRKDSVITNENCEECDGFIPKSLNYFNDQEPTNSQISAKEATADIGEKFPLGTSQSNHFSSVSSSKHGSLATSFLLGEVELDVLKANVFSQFPSLCGSQANPEDIMKLQNFMTEYVELKNKVTKTNTSMRQHFSLMQKWQNDIKSYKEQQDKQMMECHELIAKLRNENMELKKELDTVQQHIEINEKIMKSENEDLVQKISEKSSVIENMCAQIEKLEQSQLQSFEYIKRNDEESLPEHEYIRVSDHKSIVKKYERELSEVLAGKLDLEDMKKIYIDEIDCLKVNLTAAEELLKMNQAEISLLKSKDCEKSELFEKYDKEKEELKQEMILLRTQVEVYCKDFQMERTARENLAGEKEQLITDLKMLQRRNQQLIEEASARLEDDARRHASNSSIPRKKIGPIRKECATSTTTKDEEPEYNTNNFVCPLCSLSFKCLDALQIHVQECLDKA